MPSSVASGSLISVSLLFLFLAGIALLGFIINALFDKIRITKVLPLMLIGLLVGPVLHIVDSGPYSTVAALTPYITALAIAFILFDVGLNINIFRLRKVLRKATQFTFALSIVTGLMISAIAFVVMHWGMIESLIFGFALAGPSAAIAPTLVRSIETTQELKTTLMYEGVVTDTLQLVVPILLFEILTKSGVTIAGAAGLVVGAVFGSAVFGTALAFFWLYILNRFKRYSKNYLWTLTITIVIATYGMAQLLNFSSAVTVFVFGLVFSNLGSVILKNENATSASSDGDMRRGLVLALKRYFFFVDTKSVRNYQREIEFFTSTFFFVYIGMLFNASNADLLLLVVGVLTTLIIILLRILFIPMIEEYISGKGRGVVKRVASFNVSRGMSPAIVATLPLALGIVIPGFLDEIFLIILFSNIASAIGIFYTYKSGARHTGG